MEMLAVIVLLGIVAVIVVQAVGHNVEKGRYDAGKAQLAVIEQAISNYNLDNGSPPLTCRRCSRLRRVPRTGKGPT